jgi:hypothetical protein
LIDVLKLLRLPMDLLVDERRRRGVLAPEDGLAERENMSSK